MKKITQQEAIFYTLYGKFRKKDHEYIPVFKLMGEVWCEEKGLWGYVSYECSARASEMIKANPQLIQRTTLVGRSGAKYYGYRIVPDAQPSFIKDEKILAFYRAIGGRKVKSEREENIEAARNAVNEFNKKS